MKFKIVLMVGLALSTCSAAFAESIDVDLSKGYSGEVELVESAMSHELAKIDNSADKGLIKIVNGVLSISNSGISDSNDAIMSLSRVMLFKSFSGSAMVTFDYDAEGSFTKSCIGDISPCPPFLSVEPFVSVTHAGDVLWQRSTSGSGKVTLFIDEWAGQSEFSLWSNTGNEKFLVSNINLTY